MWQCDEVHDINTDLNDVTPEVWPEHDTVDETAKNLDGLSFDHGIARVQIGELFPIDARHRRMKAGD